MPPLEDVSLLRTLVATVLSMAAGFVWYSPKVFGTAWMKSVNMPNAKPSKKEMQSAVLKGLIATFLTVYVFGLLLILTDIHVLSEAIKLSIVLWFGTFFAAELHRVAWEQKPPSILWINGGSFLSTSIIAALVFTA